jgi:hypothetical protein
MLPSVRDLFPQHTLLFLVKVCELLKQGRILRHQSTLLQKRQDFFWQGLPVVVIGNIVKEFFARDSSKRIANLTGHILSQICKLFLVFLEHRVIVDSLSVAGVISEIASRDECGGDAVRWREVERTGGRFHWIHSSRPCSMLIQWSTAGVGLEFRYFDVGLQ